jgi:hypothetical protein
MSGVRLTLEQRVVRAAEAALETQRFASPVDVLVGIGWLPPRRVADWRQGRVECLEAALSVKPSRLAQAMAALSSWAAERALVPSETTYVAQTRDRRLLRFTRAGDAESERAFRTHWVSRELSEPARERLRERASRPPDLVVVSALREWTCAECGGTGDLLLMEDAGPLCMTCADLDHLEFLPAGDAALTRRAKRASRLSAVVVRFSRSRRRYERQGILVEQPALERAEAECLADADARARRRLRDDAARAAADSELEQRISAEIARLLPGCPPERAAAIARHTAQRGSGRVGRSAAGRRLDPHAVELAVVAAVRHEDTIYDELLMSGLDRAAARDRVHDEVAAIIESWR